LLNKAVDQETNDDTRNIMLESLAEKRFAILTLSNGQDMIDKAEGRKKLTAGMKSGSKKINCQNILVRQ
jgi:hypothetical protein